MAYKLIDKNGQVVTLRDLQNKGPWCVDGASFEDAFIQKYGAHLGLIINPEKKSNKYSADLLNVNNRTLGDLKTQNTPFFEAQTRYSVNPQFAVTFNEKDFLRYSDLYPGIEIYFWVVWIITRFESGHNIEVVPMEGVWKITLDNIKTLVKSSPLHYYQQRVYDNRGNAKGSYVFDLGSPLFEKVI